MIMAVLASLQGQAALLVSGVFAARLLGVEGRGMLALIILFPSTISLLAALGVPSAAVYFIAGRPNAGARLAGRLAVIFRRQAIGALLIHGAALIWMYQAGATPGLLIGSLIVLPATVLMLMLQYGLAYLQALERWPEFNFIRALPASLYAVGMLGLFMLGWKSVTAAAGVWLLAYAVAGSAAYRRGWPSSAEPPQRADPASRSLIGFGVRGLAGAASPVEALRLDQLLIGILLSPASLGLYAAGLSFSHLPRLVAQSTGMVSYPRIASKALHSRSEAMAEMIRYCAIGSVLTIGATAILYALIPRALPWLFGHDFTPATAAAQVLVLGSGVMSIRRLLAESARGLGLPTLGSVGELASWIIFVPAALFGAREGIVGVAWASTAAAGGSLSVLLASIFWLRWRESEAGQASEAV